MTDANTHCDDPLAGLLGPPPGSRGNDPPVRAQPQLNLDEAHPEQGLVALVLTLVELIRQLMERQALRRIDYGDLDPESVERLGEALMALEQQLTQLRDHFGLTAEDLNLDLGPLGPLLPRD